ncbi:DUF445 domain-containing protein [Rhodohalobacter sp. 614A]|uniref:DUF445 domain-containing protein n=1 Tax=Rhodohalobacter sp. 614A TaxID=2908649 RepID=UPI001F1E18AA|nr:DUF445 family protein [Rhodohalobacter sp. 614A]
MEIEEKEPLTPKTVGKKSEESHFKKLGQILSKYLEFDSDGDSKKVQVQAAPEISKLPILQFLKPIPWILCVLFLFSFLWDFEGMGVEIFGMSLQFDGLIRIISVSGLIGYLTNWIAITMLFKPVKKRPLLGQGLVPAHKNRIAYRLSHAVSDDLINPELIKQKIRESKAISRYRLQAIEHMQEITEREDFREDLKEWILNYVDSIVQNPEFRKKVSDHILLEIEDALQNKAFEKVALKTYSFLSGQTLQEFIENLLERLPVTAERNIGYIEEYLDEFPDKIHRNSDKIDELITQLLYKLINQLNVQTLVEENLKKYDEQRLESMIRNATNEQLKTIQYLGAVLGTIGGFVIWEPILSLIGLTLIFGTIYLIDRQLYQQ